MFIPPEKVTKDSGNVMQVNLADKVDAKSIMSVSQSMPGRFHFGDITSDGYPDLLVTLQLQNGKSKTLFLLNRPCTLEYCSQKAI